MLKSKIRPLTIIFSLGIIFCLGTVPYVLFIKKKLTEINVATITAFILFLLIITGLIAIQRLTLFITLNENQNKIVFNYLFRLAKDTYSLNEIDGFRFKYIWGKIDYKGLQVKAKNGKKYTITDFETKNLRQFEQAFKNNLELKAQKTFKSLNTRERNNELKISEEFDKEQEKSIKFYLFMTIGLGLMMIFIITWKSNSLNIPNSIITILSLLIIFGSIRRLRAIKNKNCA